ncbi:MAG: integrase [Halieaceae bacterium]
MFPNKKGKHMTSIKTAWNKLVKDAGLQPTGFHGLRRTFGSKLISNGVNSLRVARLMGHSSVTVTERHYIGLLQEENRKAVADLMA